SVGFAALGEVAGLDEEPTDLGGYASAVLLRAALRVGAGLGELEPAPPGFDRVLVEIAVAVCVVCVALRGPGEYVDDVLGGEHRDVVRVVDENRVGVRGAGDREDDSTDDGPVDVADPLDDVRGRVAQRRVRLRRRDGAVAFGYDQVDPGAGRDGVG